MCSSSIYTSNVVVQRRTFKSAAATVVQCIKIPFTWESERGVYSGAAEKNIVAILDRYSKSDYY